MKPLIRLADLMARHKGQSNWSEMVVSDKYNQAQVISAAPGTKIAMHLHTELASLSVTTLRVNRKGATHLTGLRPIFKIELIQSLNVITRECDRHDHDVLLA